LHGLHPFLQQAFGQIFDEEWKLIGGKMSWHVEGILGVHTRLLGKGVKNISHLKILYDV
jgi:hypothetical protein